MWRSALMASVLIFAFAASAADSRKPDAEAVKQLLQKRLKSEQFKTGTGSNVKLALDGKTLLDMPGGKIETTTEEVGGQLFLVVKIDGKEVSRVPLQNGALDADGFPPLVLKDINSAGVRCESQSINGVSSTTVWVDGNIVYQGSGSSSSTKSRSVNGQKSVEVTVDGNVVYHATEAAK
jgi:hypothetical protein